MTTEQNKPETSASQLKNIQTENELLLVQIHQLEEELEHYFKRNQELEKGQSTKSGSGELGICWVDDEFPDALAEMQRLHALVQVIQKAHQLETENALNVKLGNILIESVDSLGNFVTVPGKIGKIWRQSSRNKLPKALGGKGFNKVIAAYGDGGFKAVEKLFVGLSLSPAMQANAYTALARHLMKSDRAAAAEAARRAYEIDPKPFRLKWLAFRLHEAGDVLEAEAMLDILPTDITFSESELRQANQLRNEAKHVRQHEAKQKTRFSARRAEVERRVSELQTKITQEKEENELILLQLHQAQEELQNQYGKLQTLINEQLKHKKENELLRHQIDQMQEELENLVEKCQRLEQAKAQLEKENVELVGQSDEQAKLASERQRQIEQITEEKARIASEFSREIEALRQTQARVEKEKAVLANQKDEQVKHAKQLNDQLREARQAASLSLKLQMLREADLKDLQARYQASQSKEENQHQLLSKLGERLNTASAYFNEIVNKGTLDFFQEERNLQTVRELQHGADGSEEKP